MGICVNYRFRRPLTQQVYDRLRRRAEQLCAASGVELDTAFSDARLEINGVGDDACEALVLPVGLHHPFTTRLTDLVDAACKRGHTFFVKTNGRPYEAVVVAVLWAARYEMRLAYAEDVVATGFDIVELAPEALGGQMQARLQLTHMLATTGDLYWGRLVDLRIHHGGEDDDNFYHSEFGMLNLMSRHGKHSKMQQWLLTAALSRRVLAPEIADVITRALSRGEMSSDGAARVYDAMAAAVAAHPDLLTDLWPF